MQFFVDHYLSFVKCYPLATVLPLLIFMISDYPFGILKLFSQIAMVKLMDNRSLQLIFGGVGHLFS